MIEADQVLGILDIQTNFNRASLNNYFQKIVGLEQFVIHLR